MILALGLMAHLSLAAYPKDASPAPCEKAAEGPLQVCAEMAQAAKSDDLDTLVGHTTAYARARFSEKTKLALKGLHHLLIGVRCVRIDREDDAAKPPRALIWLYVPEGRSRDVPFVKENGFWRYDHQTYEQMHKKS